MQYELHRLSPSQFEKLVHDLCVYLLGMGTQGFSEGQDGGRDAKFVGTANRYPSERSPWTGTIIIQAKHTKKPYGSFSDSDFGSAAASSTISEELPKIKKLYDNQQLTHYILFSNRRLSANTNEALIQRIHDGTGIPIESIRLAGVENVETYAAHSTTAKNLLSDFEYDLPLRISAPKNFADVIEAIVQNMPDIKTVSSPPPGRMRRVAFTEKNKINGLSENYANYIKRNYLKYIPNVKRFLENSRNYKAYEAYQNTVEEFSSKMIAQRHKFETYDILLNHVIEELIDKSGTLKSNESITRLVFYYMYWSCDIGTTADEYDSTT